MMSTPAEMGPLSDGQTVAIIGGGPGGIACALALTREATSRGIALNILIFEGKRFEVDFNQCSGILSPPLLSILAEHAIVLPPSLIQREILGYVLHADTQSLVLSGDEYGGVSLAVHRAEFDHYLMQCARERGARIIPTRVSDLEFHSHGARIFTWQGTHDAAVIVGAFGLSRAMTSTLARYTAYRPPRTLDTVITRIHPDGYTREFIPDLLDNHIHVILPPLPRVEFGAVIPKGNHIAVIVAGRQVTTADMDAVLALPAIRRLLPAGAAAEEYYKGRFPISVARGMFGDRYVAVGDAAGLVRPFKGKGINSSMISGALAARTMLDEGVSAQAFTHYAADCRDITGDIGWGGLVRKLAWFTSHHLSMDAILREATRDAALRELLFDCVSGRESYRHIVRRRGNLLRALRLGLAAVVDRLRGS